jgi:hypothetical protein
LIAAAQELHQTMRSIQQERVLHATLAARRRDIVGQSAGAAHATRGALEQRLQSVGGGSIVVRSQHQGQVIGPRHLQLTAAEQQPSRQHRAPKYLHPREPLA